MKKLGLLLMAFALVLTFSRCKKNEATTPTNEGEKVFVTLNIGSNGLKHDVVPETGAINFTNGDVIQVASNGVYVGVLTYNGAQFTGNITEPTEGQKLHFYFFGNVNPTETLIEGTTSGCSVIISDQTTKLPVISYAPSRENYEIGRTAYNATLLNKCALVKFNVNTNSQQATCITGRNNKVVVNFSTSEFTYDQEGDGIITLAAGNGERWAILLPQDVVTNSEAHSSDGMNTGTCATIPTINENDYLTSGIIIAINHPIGTVNGVFSVSALKQVYFSKGNLQYQASTNTWRFAENQWDYIGSQNPNSGNAGGTVSGSDNKNISQTYNGWIDLFGWGTSGVWHLPHAICYQPWSTSQYYNDYYAYGDWQNSLNQQGGKADWGYNAISNGNNQENQWHTLTQPQWSYVFHSRQTVSGKRYAKATVNGISGVILLPDNWSVSTYNLKNTDNSGISFNTNIISLENWINILENAGAVFLPVTGYRNGTTIYNVGTYGYYWSASYSSAQYSYRIYLMNGTVGTSTSYFDYRNLGYAVRLVRDVE